MSHFAQIENDVVVQVLVVEQEFIDTGALGDPKQWIQTSYNTRGGVHYGADNRPDDGTALRKNYACIGYTYDAIRDAFIPPKPYPSWTLNEETCLWNAPIPEPDDGKAHEWDEDAQIWLSGP